MINKVLQKLIPKRLITKIFGWMAKKELGFITTLFIKSFIFFYKINLSEYKNQNVCFYKTFNDFFIRKLNFNKRYIDFNANVIILPVDGVITQIGKVYLGKDKNIFGIKNTFYNLDKLLGGNKNIVDIFKESSCFVTIYLSPKNYHRVHMPCNGILKTMLYIPGSLFSVKGSSMNSISNILSENERIVCLFDTEFGPMLVILIGSMIVGSIQVVWWSNSEIIPHSIINTLWKYYTFSDYINNQCNYPIVLLKGQEIGRFILGSTVMLFFLNRYIMINDILKNNSISYIGKILAYSCRKINYINYKI